ncbi:Hypothetical protein I5071_1430 (plasmid) [Sandaracinus amylolyticus]|nr:Hypothetical protein I5071_1430 [Sandaracinus amylolyticus]
MRTAFFSQRSPDGPAAVRGQKDALRQTCRSAKSRSRSADRTPNRQHDQVCASHGVVDVEPRLGQQEPTRARTGPRVDDSDVRCRRQRRERGFEFVEYELWSGWTFDAPPVGHARELALRTGRELESKRHRPTDRSERSPESTSAASSSSPRSSSACDSSSDDSSAVRDSSSRSSSTIASVTSRPSGRSVGASTTNRPPRTRARIEDMVKATRFGIGVHLERGAIHASAELALADRRSASG